MATTIVMPQMGYDMHEGTVVRWHKQEGDTVALGEVIAEIETDKAIVDFEAFKGGVLRKIIAPEGVVIPVGDLIAVITDPDEELPEGILAAAAPAAASTQPVASPTPQTPSQEESSVPAEGEIRASPIARRLAQERGIDLASITGTGPNGRIQESDIPAHEEAAPSSAAPPVPDIEVRASPIARRLARERGIELFRIPGTGPEGRVQEADVLAYEPSVSPKAEARVEIPVDGKVELSRMRQTIAKVTSDSKRDAPHFYLTAEIDMTKAMDFRREVNDAAPSGVRVSVNDLIVKACAIALGRHPKFNSSFQGEYLQMNSSMNIGIAIALEAGLMVPGISGCQGKSLLELAVASTDLIERANNGSLRNEEYSGTTFSVSNLGMFDVESFAAIIYPPHAAVLAVGSVMEQPVAREGQVVLAQMMKATLSVDHRVADGAEAAQFLMEIKALLEAPVKLVL